MVILSFSIASPWQVIVACSRGGNWAKALEVLAEAQAHGKGDEAAYNSVISALGKAGRWEKAIEVFDQMPQFRVPRTEYACIAILSALAKNGRWEKTLEMFQKMREDGVPLDEKIYAAVS